MNIEPLKLAAQHPGVDIGSRIKDHHFQECNNDSDHEFLYSHVDKHPDELIKMFHSSDSYSSFGILKNKNLKSEHLHKIIDDSKIPISVRQNFQMGIIGNVNHDSSHLQKLITKFPSAVQNLSSIQHGNWDHDYLHKIATSDRSDQYTKQAVALNRNTSKETLQLLSKHPDRNVALSATRSLERFK